MATKIDAARYAIYTSVASTGTHMFVVSGLDDRPTPIPIAPGAPILPSLHVEAAQQWINQQSTRSLHLILASAPMPRSIAENGWIHMVGVLSA